MKRSEIIPQTEQPFSAGQSVSTQYHIPSLWTTIIRVLTAPLKPNRLCRIFNESPSLGLPEHPGLLAVKPSSLGRVRLPARSRALSACDGTRGAGKSASCRHLENLETAAGRGSISHRRAKTWMEIFLVEKHHAGAKS